MAALEALDEWKRFGRIECERPTVEHLGQVRIREDAEGVAGLKNGEVIEGTPEIVGAGGPGIVGGEKGPGRVEVDRAGAKGEGGLGRIGNV